MVRMTPFIDKAVSEALAKRFWNKLRTNSSKKNVWYLLLQLLFVKAAMKDKLPCIALCYHNCSGNIFDGPAAVYIAENFNCCKKVFLGKMISLWKSVFAANELQRHNWLFILSFSLTQLLSTIPIISVCPRFFLSNLFCSMFLSASFVDSQKTFR